MLTSSVLSQLNVLSQILFLITKLLVASCACGKLNEDLLLSSSLQFATKDGLAQHSVGMGEQLTRMEMAVRLLWLEVHSPASACVACWSCDL